MGLQTDLCRRSDLRCGPNLLVSNNQSCIATICKSSRELQGLPCHLDTRLRNQYCLACNRLHLMYCLQKLVQGPQMVQPLPMQYLQSSMLAKLRQGEEFLLLPRLVQDFRNR